jgi:hypothetical protein
MKAHLDDAGVAENTPHKIPSDSNKAKVDVWQTFADTLLLLSPFIPNDGLVIVKYQLPMPQEWFTGMLWVREGRLALRKRFGEATTGRHVEVPSDTQDMPPLRDTYHGQYLRWVAAIFDFWEREYHDHYYSVPGFMPIIGKNAPNPRAHKYLPQCT